MPTTLAWIALLAVAGGAYLIGGLLRGRRPLRTWAGEVRGVPVELRAYPRSVRLYVAGRAVAWQRRARAPAHHRLQGSVETRILPWPLTVVGEVVDADDDLEGMLRVGDEVVAGQRVRPPLTPHELRTSALRRLERFRSAGVRTPEVAELELAYARANRPDAEPDDPELARRLHATGELFLWVTSQAAEH